MTRWAAAAFTLVAAAMLAACGKPVPAEKASYVGEWQQPAMYLLITADGTVKYERLQRGGQTSVQGPLKGFNGDNFDVGFAFFSTTFVVSKPPYEERGEWKMVVDGVELTRTSTLR